MIGFCSRVGWRRSKSVRNRSYLRKTANRLMRPHTANGLDRHRTKSEHQCMDDRDRLALYPFVVVRIGCRQCSRKGAYRLARLAAKFGPDITLRDLTNRFSYDCMWRAEARSKKGK